MERPAPPRGHRSPIDVFFRSLAEDAGEMAVGIVLSGTGSDGTIGLRAIKENGGMGIAEDPTRAKYDSMPRSPVIAGYVDHVLPAENMPAMLLDYARNLRGFHLRRSQAPEKEGGDIVRRLSALLRERTGHDFSHYKRNTLLRRIQRRIQVTGTDSIQTYFQRLQSDPREAGLLLKDLLIGVTQFFRDPEAFASLEQQVLPALFERSEPDTSMRVWVAGCASGEEAYSLAMLLREYVVRTGKSRPIQIFATDIDDEALEVARRGSYPQGISDQLSAERLERFFVKQGSSYVVAKELRDLCTFSLHDLLRDPPFSHLNLVSCRNLLIYLECEAQRKLVPLFHYALDPGGFLLLGPSENVTGHADIFATVDKKARVFRRKELSVPRFLDFPLEPAIPSLSRPVQRDPAVTALAIRQSVGEQFRRAILEDFAPAAVLVNRQGEILQVSGRTGRHGSLTG